MNEQALSITGPHGDMLGILSLPPASTPPQRTGVLIVVGGAQYRVGSHRQFVQLARHLAAAGHPVLRFDAPGLGDSPGEPVAFDASAGVIGAAVDALHHACPSLTGTVLWGLCDGASASLLYLQARPDPRIAGLALLNPWVRDEHSLARAQVKHYYRQRLLEPAFWRKLLGGGVGAQALRGLLANLRRGLAAPPATEAAIRFQDRMAQVWRDFPGPILLLLSERDLTAQEFVEHARGQPAWAGALTRPRLALHWLPGADHTCSAPGNWATAMAHSQRWLARLAPPPP